MRPVREPNIVVVNVTDYEWRQACFAVIHAARQAKPDALIQYAATYARAGLSMTEDTDERRTQALYIMSNLSGWRGTEAQEAKAVFRAAGKSVRR